MTDFGDAFAALRWYAEMGIDAVVDATPHDRFAEHAATQRDRAEAPSPAPASQPAAARPPAATSTGGEAGRRPPLTAIAAASPPRPQPTTLFGDAAAQSADAAVMSARELAAAARSLDELKAAVAAFESCTLKATATQIAFSDGDPAGGIMAVGEAPGAEEDRHGTPFCGRSGQLLDLMLKAIGLDRTKVYVANVVPWRPPGNRTPTPQEISICRPFITRQIELAAPRFLLCLGGPATQTLLGTKEGILRTRGRWLDYPGPHGPIRAMPMLHPAYLLRQPAHKKLAWRDLLALRQALDADTP
ncbi:uracil-DNA glycosylase [Lichenihabitans sp. Uapishka_5]|uniref:uracil-DNA glycosylase n=1 Tax=Lichenihabitans sp. Uapishka_5 TaxID=3037302 RepID=UPI0029E80BD1|nr:uracil-DNA glycosylase [Lichenihabitans sp. Uapishka_5]MDX7951703.1 uracil-DNA glycosylase [Lichenihabitans sp. Uapishka_5]